MAVDDLKNRVGEMEAKLDEVKDTVLKHDLRLDTGVKTFDANKKRLATIEEQIRPKPPSIYTIIGITLTIVFAGAGSIWGLANMLRDRPTANQIQEIFKSHNRSGHQTIRDDTRAVQTEQAAQRTLIEGVKTEQKIHTGKLDTLLDRVPKPPRP
jgi:hypothetical protein